MKPAHSGKLQRMESPQHTASLASPYLAPPARPNVKDGYKARYVGMMAVTQVLLGCLAFVLQLWDIGNKSEMSTFGAGIWSGTFFIVTGFMGLVAANQKNVCWIVTHMVMSIVASLLAIGLMFVSAMSLSYYSNCDSNDMCNHDVKTSAIPVYAVLMLVSVVQGVTGVISSSLACHGCCFSDQRVTSHPNPAHNPASTKYVQGPNGQLLLVTGQQSHLVTTTTGQHLLIAGTPGGSYQILGLHEQSPVATDAVSQPHPQASSSQLPSYQTVTEEEAGDQQPLLNQSAANLNTDANDVEKLPSGGI